MPFAEGDLPTILALLGELESRREVDDLFRRKGASFSASNWDEFLEKRVPAAIRDRRVSVDELAALLHEAEEHGRQHIFLYRTTRETALHHIDETRLRRGLQRLGSPTILDSPRVLDKPPIATFVEARIEYTPRGQPKALVLKQVATRETRELVEERRVGRRIHIELEVDDVRTVNLVKLNDDGLCEVRLQSHKNPKDLSEAGQLLIALQDVVPAGQLRQYTLTRSRDRLFANREQLRNEIRYTSSTLRNARGSVIAASASTEVGDLFADRGMVSTLDEFMEHDAYCDTSNLWFRVGERSNNEPNWVHALLSGQDNEFALTARCSSKEYNSVLATLRRHA